MRSLTKGILFVFVTISFLPSAAAAGTPLIPSKCPNPSAADPQGATSLVMTQDLPEGQAEQFLKTAIYCPSACYDLTVQLTLKKTGLTSGGLDVMVTPRNACTGGSQDSKRGCVNGAMEPRVQIITQDTIGLISLFNAKTWEMPAQTINKSRCDDTVIYRSFNDFLGGLATAADNPTAGVSAMQTALSNLQSQTDPRPTAPVLEAGSAPLSSVTDKVVPTTASSLDVPAPTKPSAELALPGGSLLDMTNMQKVSGEKGAGAEAPSPFAIDPFSSKYKPETGVQIEKLSSDAAELPKTSSPGSFQDNATSKFDSVEFNVSGGAQSSSSSISLVDILQAVIKLLAQLFSKTFGTTPTSFPQYRPALVVPTISISVSAPVVERGTPITVRWLSSGTSPLQPCQIITSEGDLIGSSNAGMQVFVPDVTSSSPLTFTAICFGNSGQTVQQSASVILQ